ncbi:hypothetical protein [Nocardioides sp. B-3]|uniref:hypothetical protein n=1 Tax=Nocardioides sp. B-3 TaxID=2895565 RepID=UPI00215331EC|nr:hypothetical protein [Nocardioides sp. B-3]UUZ60319.1 hypothetical protein LP418_05170 [Nocardioides sp. B-3]
MDDDPRHVFLHASDVIRRHDWGKTKGYQNLKDRSLVPPPVMTHPDRWRLNQLSAREERRMAMAEATLQALVAPDRDQVTITDLLPQPKRRPRSA